MDAFAFALCLVGLPVTLGFTLPKLFVLALCAWRQGWDGWDVPRDLRGPLVACLAALILSAAGSVDRAMSVMGRFDSWAYGVVPCLMYAAVFLMSCRNPPTRKALGWLGVVLSVHAVLQIHGLDPIVPFSVLPMGPRAISYVGSPVDLAAILVMLYFMAEWWQCPIIAIGLWACGSRAGAGAVALGYAAYIWPRQARWIACLSLLFFLVPARLPKDRARQEVWKSAADTFRAHPILGAGPDTFILTFTGERLEQFRALIKPMSTQAQAHNDLLQAAATTGILGLLAYLWLLCGLPAAPALVALFAYMKFDGVSLEVLAIAAMVAGLECRDAAMGVDL